MCHICNLYLIKTKLQIYVFYMIHLRSLTSKLIWACTVLAETASLSQTAALSVQCGPVPSLYLCLFVTSMYSVCGHTLCSMGLSVVSHYASTLQIRSVRASAFLTFQ